MTQSAVSQHVATLERAMDLPLIERGTRPVQLTDAGFALVRHARALLARIGNAEQELGEITGRRNGRLRFGSFPTALATFVPAALARFQRQHADVSLTVIDDHLQRLLPRLDDGELDLAITHAMPHVEVRPIRGLAPVRRIWAARPRDPFCPAAARAMIDTLQLTITSGAAVRRPERPG